MFVHFSQLFFAVSFTHFVLQWSFHVHCYCAVDHVVELQSCSMWLKPKAKQLGSITLLGLICDNLTIVEVISVWVMKFLWLSDS